MTKPNTREGKKRHPDYGLIDQARGRCPYCLASAEIDCDCERKNITTKPNTNKWEEKSDEIVIDFFEKLRPSKKGEAYTFLIPLMVELKMNLEEAIKQSRQEFAEELLEKIEKIKAAKVEGKDETINDVAFNTWNEAMNKVLEIIKVNK